MADGGNLHRPASLADGGDVRPYDEAARAGNETGRADLRVVREFCSRRTKALRNLFGRGGIPVGNVCDLSLQPRCRLGRYAGETTTNQPAFAAACLASVWAMMSSTSSIDRKSTRLNSSH